MVEDCGSTDGTWDLFEAAAAVDSRVRTFQRFGTSSGEVLLAALRRCRGEYVVICPSEGYILPNAFDVVAREFATHPTVGAVCTAGFMINGFGCTLDHADMVTLLFTSYHPFLPAAFFRREALLTCGLEREDWLCDSLALELCCRVAADWGLASCVEQVVYCRDPSTQTDGLTHDLAGAVDNRLRLVSRIFSRDGFFAGLPDALASESKANQLGILWQEFRDAGRDETEYRVMPHLAAVASELHQHIQADDRSLRSLHRLFCIRSHNLGLLSSPLQKMLAAASRMPGRLAIQIGRAVWNLPLWGYWLKRKIILLTLPAARYHSAAPSWDAMHADLYALTAERYEGRGQIDAALAMWDRARPPDNDTIDSLACQAALKSPTATEASLAERQRAWVRRHLGNRPEVAMPRQTRDKIRIAYHCAFMHGDTMRIMMCNVIAAHDRSRFEVYGYSPHPPVADIQGIFDVWRHTPGVLSGSAACSDQQFAELIRADSIDVFVECTGFSSGHRFGAMSQRCAPVQISFLNHTGTSQMPNVDYVLSDEVCTPSDSDCQRYYSNRFIACQNVFLLRLHDIR